MNNDDFKEVPDNIQDNNEETTNNIDNTNDNKANDYEDVCYICRRPESVAGKMIHIQPNLCICNDCMQKTFDSMSNGKFGNLGNLGNISNMDFGNMPNISMINLSDLTGGIPNSQKQMCIRDRPMAHRLTRLDLSQRMSQTVLLYLRQSLHMIRRIRHQ